MTSPWLSVRHPLDRLIAAIVGLLTLPLIGILAVVARRSSPGPAMVRLARIGRHGRPFGMMKLRTMRTDRPDGVATGGALTAGRHDPRVTTLGRYLRVSRLDELPQLLHVVAGTMAVIGPRPEAVAYVDLDDSRWRAVLRARPGIAGPSQVLFRHWEERVLADASSSSDVTEVADVDDVYGEAVLPLKLTVDEWYVRNASPVVDAVIIAALAEQYILLRETTVAHHWFRKRIPELDSAGFMDGRRGGTRPSLRSRSS